MERRDNPPLLAHESPSLRHARPTHPTAVSNPPAVFAHARLLTRLCWGAMGALAIGLNLLPVCLITIGHSFGGAHGLDEEQLGRLGGISFLGVVLGILVCGPLADRFGAKLFALGGNALLALGLVLVATASSYLFLALGFFILGLGGGVLDMVLSPVVAALNPQRRSSAMNWLHSFYCVGAVITVLVGTAALHVGLSWRYTFLLLLPLPAALTIAFARLPFPDLVSDVGRTPFVSLLRKRWFVLALLAICCGGATELGLAQWLPAYAQTTLDFAPWIGGLALLTFSLAMAIGRMAIGMAGTRVNPYHVIILASLGSVVLMLLGALLPQPGVALACCVLAGLTGSCLWPTLLAVCADRYPHGGGSMFAALSGMGNAGGIMMPWLVGVVGDHAGLRLGLGLCALAPFGMAVLVMAMRPARQLLPLAAAA